MALVLLSDLTFIRLRLIKAIKSRDDGEKCIDINLLPLPPPSHERIVIYLYYKLSLALVVVVTNANSVVKVFEDVRSGQHAYSQQETDFYKE